MVQMKIHKKLNGLRKRAKKRQLDFNLDSKWFNKKLSVGVCEATGVSFVVNNNSTINPKHPSVDRVNSDRGYTKDNCKIVSQIYNVAKGDQSEEVLIEWAKLFVEKYENEIILEKSVQYKNSKVS